MNFFQKILTIAVAYNSATTVYATSSSSTTDDIVTLTVEELAKDVTNMTDTEVADLFSRIDEAFGVNGKGLVAISGGEQFQNDVSYMRNNFLPMGHRLGQHNNNNEPITENDKDQINAMRGETDPLMKPKNQLRGKFYNGHWLNEQSFKEAINFKYSMMNNNNNNNEDKEYSEFAEFGNAATGLMVNVGLLLGKKLDFYLEHMVDGYQSGYLEESVSNEDHFCRLLAYKTIQSEEEMKISGGYWARPHADASLLTGLMPSVFTDENGNIVDAKNLPNSEDLKGTGLHVVDRNGHHHKIATPQKVKELGGEALYFQLGEYLNVASGGKLQATPHYVVGPKNYAFDSSHQQHRYKRNTLAVFFNNQNKIAFPTSMSLSDIAENTFDFSTIVSPKGERARWPSLKERLQLLDGEETNFLNSSRDTHSIQSDAFTQQTKNIRLKKYY